MALAMALAMAVAMALALALAVAMAMALAMAMAGKFYDLPLRNPNSIYFVSSAGLDSGGEGFILITRAWSMPNRWTFRMKPASALLDKYVKDLGAGWADPFCGHSLLAQHRNDLDPKNAFATHHSEAKEFLMQFHPDSLSGVLFDPPYSPRQITECYKKIGKKTTQQDTQNQWTKEKDLIALIIKPEGYCISFGWNSNGLGKKRGFEIVEVLMIAHGAAHNDTIITVERKV